MRYNENTNSSNLLHHLLSFHAAKLPAEPYIPKVGSLRPGKRADFIAVDLHAPTMMPVYTEPMRNIVPNLVYSARGNEVSLVCVEGQILLENGKLQTMDEETIIADAQACVPELAARASKAFWEVNGSNAALMREGKL